MFPQSPLEHIESKRQHLRLNLLVQPQQCEKEPPNLELVDINSTRIRIRTDNLDVLTEKLGVHRNRMEITIRATVSLLEVHTEAGGSYTTVWKLEEEGGELKLAETRA